MIPDTNSRYPYTYACDYLRGYGGYDAKGVRLSRADASKIRQAVAVALGMDDETLAQKLADYYLANEARLSQESAQQLIQAIRS